MVCNCLTVVEAVGPSVELYQIPKRMCLQSKRVVECSRFCDSLHLRCVLLFLMCCGGGCFPVLHRRRADSHRNRQSRQCVSLPVVAVMVAVEVDVLEMDCATK